MSRSASYFARQRGSSAHRVKTLTLEKLIESLRIQLSLETLECRLDSIEANWDEHHTLQILVIIGLRALSLSVRDTAVERAAEFLRRCRKVTMRWIRDLIINLELQIGTQSQAQQLLLKRLGGICQLTYAVESQYLISSAPQP